MTADKIEGADNEIANNEITENKNADTEIANSKSSTPGLPDYDQVTENQTKNAEEIEVPEFRSQTPTELFAAKESTVEPFAQPTQPVTKQTQVVQPVGNHVRVHPAPVVAVVSSNPPPIHTSCCECDGPWCSYCCCGVCCHVATGLSLNHKLKESSTSGDLRCSMFWWWYDLIVFLLCFVGMMVSSIMIPIYDDLECDWDDSKLHCSSIGPCTITALLCFSILTVLGIVRIYTRFTQRRLFMRDQAEKGHYPNNEGCIISFLGSWFCSPCFFGQMYSAIQKQKLLSLMQPQHTVSYNV